jgi:hypothetical protein
MRLCRHKRLSTELRPTTSEGHQLLHRGRRYHYPKEALGIHYGNFDVVLPTRLPQTHTSTTPDPNVSGSDMASSAAQALEAFNRLSAQEKVKVLGYITAAHPHKAVQETEGEETEKLMMLAMVLLLIFTICFYIAWTIAVSSTQ